MGDKQERSWHHSLEHRPAKKILFIRWQIKISTSVLDTGYLVLDRDCRIITWIIGRSIGVVVDRCIGLQKKTESS